MKDLRKILKYITVISVSLVLILYLISAVFEKSISAFFTRELNKKLNTTVSAGELNFSLLKRFPRASVGINDIYVSFPRKENRQSGYHEYSDTLLYAKKMILTLRIGELLRKNYIIDRIDVNHGIINLYSGPEGELNTGIFKEEAKDNSSSIGLNINMINIDNSIFTFKSESSGFYIKGELNKSSNKLITDNNCYELRSRSEFILSGLETGGNYHLDGPLPFRFTAGLDICNDTLLIHPSEIEFEDLQVNLDGIINTSEHQLSLSLESKYASAASIGKLLPLKVNEFITGYNIEASVSSSIKIGGNFKENPGLPLIAVLGIEKGSFTFPSTDTGLDNIQTEATLEIDLSKPGNNFEVQADKYEANINDTDISGSFLFRDLQNPYIDISLNGLMQSSRLFQLINTENLNSSAGTVRVNARISGIRGKGQGDLLHDITQMNRSVNIGLNSVDLELPGLDEHLDNINGNIMIADDIWIDDLSLVHNEQNIIVNGLVRGFNKWLPDRAGRLEITAGLWSGKVDLNLFKDKFSGQTGKTGNIFKDTRLGLDINLRCDSIIIGNFNASLFEGKLSYIPGLMDIGSFSMNALGGTLEGNAALADIGNDAYALRGWFNIDNIDIKNTFSVFNNFRQDYIKAENLEGNITGNISISASADKSFRISKKGLALNGEYYILDGRLINFEPAYKLSRFMEMEELGSIEFSRLENDLIINNGMIIIPKMDISSSAFNISLEGSHSFEGDYSYRLRLILSELLSGKKNNKVSEFGIIEDDGLGRTSLYLKINGDKNGSKVSHDMAALTTGIKEDLANEKQKIKSILNEEYGWYKGEQPSEPDSSKSRRFRITWEETDSLKSGADTSSGKKSPRFKFFDNKNLKKKEPEKK